MRNKGFKKVPWYLGGGYVKPRKWGGRFHKYSPRGRYHIDKHDPSRNVKKAIKHVKYDYFRLYKNRSKR